MRINKLILFLGLIISFKCGISQNRLAYLSYTFPTDSLNGFNEMQVSYGALGAGYFGLEYKVYMYRAKRNYINNKYGYFQMINQNRKESPIINSVACLNEDFESSPVGPVTSVSGWTISEGSNTSSCSMGGCCPAVATGTNSWIRTTPLVTSNASVTIPNSPLGGTKVIQLGDDTTNQGEIVRLEQTFSVTVSNSVFNYAVFALMDGTGHLCCDQPFLNISLFDCSNTLIPGTTFSFAAQGPSCASAPVNWIVNTSGVSYHSGWQVFTHNLSAYIGSCVKVQVTVGDCDGWAHPGYCFFDAGCGSGVSTGMNSIFNDETSISVFPNPNNGVFTLEILSKEFKVGDTGLRIVNVLGQEVKKEKLLSKKQRLSIEEFSEGVYYLQLTQNNKILSVKKIVKQ